MYAHVCACVYVRERETIERSRVQLFGGWIEMCQIEMGVGRSEKARLNYSYSLSPEGGHPEHSIKGFAYFISYIFGCRDRCSTQSGGKQRVGGDDWHLLLLDSGLRL